MFQTEKLLGYLLNNQCRCVALETSQPEFLSHCLTFTSDLGPSPPLFEPLLGHPYLLWHAFSVR